ncbi:MAG: ABC transporter ATP-binding protein [Lachnospiraceae bacterium]|jgi:oligopeptide transport system ATP-binding protein
MSERASGVSSPETPVLSARHLKKYFPVSGNRRLYVHAVDDVSFDLYEGETLGLVGESGCGKSTTGRMLVGIEPLTGGQVLYRGRDLSRMKPAEMRGIRTELQMIFQDPFAALNPKKRVYDILSAPLLYHHLADRGNVGQMIDGLLSEVGLPRNAKDRYPHEFSGGQRQRIVIAKALSLNPKVIICDEPVSALDNSIQAQVLNLLKDLQTERGLTYLFIAHGLGTVHYISRRVAVMYLGKIVEMGNSDEIFRHPLHPYSQMLISSVPLPDPTKRDRRRLVSTGEIPSAAMIPSGCRFHDRCPFATPRCAEEEPPLTAAVPGSDRKTACWNTAAAEAALNGGEAGKENA